VLREALGINRQVFGASSIQAASSLNILAVTIALDQRRLPEAIALYRDAFEIREQAKDPKSPRPPSPGTPGEIRDALGAAQATSRTTSPLVPMESMLIQRASLAEVENALREAQRFAHVQYAKDSWEEAFYLALTTWVLLQENKFDEAEAPARQCLAIRMKLRPDDWSVFHARHMLGAAQAGQKRYAEAEPLLLEGYLGMNERRASMPEFHIPRLGECVLRLIKFYQDLGRTDEAAKWQGEFNRLDAEAKRSLIVSPRLPTIPAGSQGVTVNSPQKDVAPPLAPRTTSR
jgi:tetratricopeptide (TPR) repeat protein